ncbi:MAG: 50S ribosomal protein L10 [Chloroflexi bacterium]|nr:50S ribosomal protein L10 [Chloroflexota bacterium]
MPSTKNIAQVAELKEFLFGSSIVIGTNYAGLTVAQIEGLRKALRQGGSRYRVIKNALVLRAAGEIGVDRLEDILQGPVGLVVSNGDPAMGARTLTTYIRANRLALPVTGALLGTRVLAPSEVEVLANLPSREVLLGLTLGAMQATLTNLVSVLHARIASIVIVLDARRRQLEEGS